MTIERNDILAVIPTYNNEKTLARVIGDVRRYCTDVLVVNDGSTDSTAGVIAGGGGGVGGGGSSTGSGKPSKSCAGSNSMVDKKMPPQWSSLLACAEGSNYNCFKCTKYWAPLQEKMSKFVEFYAPYKLTIESHGIFFSQALDIFLMVHYNNGRKRGPI